MNTRTTNHPTCTAATVAKSIVCVALVAGLAWIGVSSVDGGAGIDPSVGAVGVATGMAVNGDRAAAHRREVFEERRARFDGQSRAQVAGSGHLEYPAP